MKKQEFKKSEERLRDLQDIFKRSNIQIIGMPEGEEEDQEIEHLFEKIMENFPNVLQPAQLPALPYPSENLRLRHFM